MKEEKYKSHIKELCEDRGLKQSTFADILGVSQQTVSRIVRAPNKAPTDLLIKIAEYFNISVDYILELSDKKRNCEGNEKIRQVIDEYYDFISEYEELSEENRKVLRIVLRGLRESQKA